MKKQIPIPIFLFLLLISCKESIIKFSEPQPKNSKEIKSFPSKLIGNYYDIENNVDLEISKYLIVKKSVLKDTFSIKDLSKFEVLENNMIINSLTSEKFFVKKINDSLFTNYVYTDTLFIINKENVLRKMKGYYFLSSKLEENNWDVKKLLLKNGQLNINGISTREEIEMLEEITETKRDTIKPFVVKPTKKQFKEFVKGNGFTEGEIYLKK